jgi:hypothetical protein
MKVHPLHDPLDDPAAVVGIHDVESWPKTGDFGLYAQLPCAEAMERADPTWRSAVAQPCPDAREHLGSSFVGEGHGENARRGNAARGNPVCDASGKGLGLARPCPGQHQHRAG